MPFKPASKEVAFVKGSMYGPPGSGKTTLLAMILLYLSITFHKKAPVAWLASEKGVDFVIDIFKLEGVPLLISRSRSFIDLKNAHAEAIKAGCCGLGIDSTTHFWRDLLTTGMKRAGRQLEKIQRVKEEWEPFAADFQDMPIHSLATGRLGYKWEDVEIENSAGEIVKELAKGGTKMKAETDFGHEPDLEIEMSAVEDPDFIKYEKVRGKARRTFKSQMLHAATIKKSRVWALNGQAYTFPDRPEYELGYYKKVAAVFRPHFDAINIGGEHHVTDANRPTCDVLFQNGSDQSYHENLLKKQIALEKWESTMALIAGGQTKDAIRWRQIIGQGITHTRSRTEFEREALPELERHLDILLALEVRLKADQPKTDEALVVSIKKAVEYVDHPGKNSTLLEAMQTGKANGTLEHKNAPVPF